MDVRMPELDGIEATRRLLANGAGTTKVVMLTTFDMDEYVYDALRAGASGFLLKDVPPEQLIDGIRAVANGDALLAPSITRRLIEEFVRAAPARTRAAGRARRADGARARGAAPHRARPVERGDRQGAVRQRDDGQDPRRPRPDEAEPPRPRAGGRARRTSRASCSPARLLLRDETRIRRAAECGWPSRPTKRNAATREALRVNHEEVNKVFHAGDQIENPVTGERIVFHETAAETNGERVVFETIVQPGGFVASAHLHPFQTERFEVLEGTLGMRRGKEKVELGAGETVVVEPGTPHKFWNAGEGEVRFVCTVTPALQFERLIATMYSLAAAGKTNRKGMPNPIRLAVIANHHFDDVRLPVVPHKLQKLALVLGAPVGRLVGYSADLRPDSRRARAGHGLERCGRRFSSPGSSSPPSSWRQAVGSSDGSRSILGS